MLDQRQSTILRAVVREYVKSARPISSEILVHKYRLGVSPATIRNEFAEMTSAGYLRQPHTSAGRAPTNRGYRHYVDSTIRPTALHSDPKVEEATEAIAELAEKLSAASGLLAAAWTEEGDTVIRGLKQILAQPEFELHEASLRIAATIDALPEIMEQVFDSEPAAGICIGSEFELWQHDDASIVFRKVRFPNRSKGVTCIIGPTRMQYLKYWKLLQ